VPDRAAQQLLGTWAVVRAELGGEPMPPEAAARVEIAFDASGRYCVRFAGEISDAGRFALGAAPAASPPPGPSSAAAVHQQITLHGERGTNARRTLHGILQLKGDRLRLCLALAGGAAPADFASRSTDGRTPHYLVTYKRKV